MEKIRSGEVLSESQERFEILVAGGWWLGLRPCLGWGRGGSGTVHPLVNLPGPT